MLGATLRSGRRQPASETFVRPLMGTAFECTAAAVTPAHEQLLSKASLAVAILAAYAWSVTGGLLNWDDPWLVSDNELIRRGFVAVPRFWFDLRGTTRMMLGAEYLPIRDMSWWVEHAMHGLNPHFLRATNLVLYVGTVLVLRRFVQTLCGKGWATELAIWLFAVHPAHVEVVAWVSSRKDLLALLFTALALYEYAKRVPSRTTRLVFFATAAMLSKSASVILPALLLLVDYYLARKPNKRALASTGLVCTAILGIHVVVGHIVGMVQQPAGGTRYTAVINFARSLLSYEEATFAPFRLALIRDPLQLTGWNTASAAGALSLVALTIVAWWCHRQGNRLPVFCLLWFLIPLAPVSGVAVPLQNLCADRYIALSLLAPSLLLANGLARLPLPWLRQTIAVAALICLLVITARRSWLFADSERVMTESFVNSPESRRAALMLGNALEEKGKTAAAIDAFTAALDRRAGQDAAAIRGALAAARLAKSLRRFKEAVAILERADAAFPRDRRLNRRLVEARMAEAGTR